MSDYEICIILCALKPSNPAALLVEQIMSYFGFWGTQPVICITKS